MFLGFKMSKIKIFFLLLCLLTNEALAHEGASETGYLEGKVQGVDVVNGSARVTLKDGHAVEADIGLLVPDELSSNESLNLKVGQRVELYYSPDPTGETVYVIVDWVRRPVLFYLIGLFLLVSMVVARLKGLRAFLATTLSLIIVTLYIVPQILAGQPPMLVSLLGIGGILILAIYFVHGLSWSTTAALLGTFVAVIITMFLGILFSSLAHLTGFGSEEAMYITISAGNINLKGLMLAGLLIGALGALTDITIVQASVIRELAHVNPKLTWADLYSRGMNVGLDHIGSLVNTLVLAYTGAALPMLILLSLNDFTWQRALNIELVASEMIQTLVGSIGLILAVPITTFVATFMFRGDKLPLRKSELALGHSHGDSND